MRRLSLEEKPWTPKTKLGLLVATGKITTIEEIFENGCRVREPEIVKKLLPDLKSIVVGAKIIQKKTDAGNLTRFNAVVAIGDQHGWFGVGMDKGPRVRLAIEKATKKALLNIIPIKLGCGNWECRCGRPHSIPYKVVGKGGGVTIEIIPGPRGLGLVAGETAKRLLELAGIKDAWTRSYGPTNTISSISYAVYDALRKLHMYSGLR